MADPINTANITIASDLDYVIGNKSAGGNLATKQVTKGNFAAALVAQMKSDAIFLPPFMVVARGGTRWQGMADYIADGVADDVTIETAAAALDAAGGGILYIAPGDYDIGVSGVQLVELTNINILGGGGTSTRLIKAVGFGGPAGISGAGCANCSVRAVYIDSNEQDGNGITFGPTSISTASGTLSTDCVAENNVVTIQSVEHNYGIFFLRVDGGRIVGNVVDGNSTTISELGQQEGVEVFGCSDVEITGNRIKNINGNALSILNFPGYDSKTLNITAHHNVVENCGSLLWINASQGDGGLSTAYTNDVVNVDVSHNIGRDIRVRGGLISVNSGDGTDSGLVVKSVRVHTNEVTFADDATLDIYQCFVVIAQEHDGSPAELADFSLVDVVHEDNIYNNVLDDQQVLSLLYTPAVRSIGNTYVGRSGGSGALGILVANSPGTELIGETIRNVQQNGINITNACDDVRIEDVTIDRWDMDDLGTSPIAFETGTAGSGIVIKDNLCDTTDNPNVNFVNFGSPASLTEWWIDGNRTRSATLTVSYEYYPVATMGANGNRGQYTMAGGATTITVNTKHCMTNSNVSVRQRSGTPQAVTLVTPAAGSFVATLAAATNGSVYDWHVN